MLWKGVERKLAVDLWQGVVGGEQDREEEESGEIGWIIQKGSLLTVYGLGLFFHL